MKILYVATLVKNHIMEFHVPYLKMLKEMGWETAVAAKNDYENPDDCVIPFCDVFYNIPIEREPFKVGNIRAYKELKKIIEDGNYDIIHCHTPVGSVIARFAAKKAQKAGCKVFYTAHGFHFYKGAPFINWLVYYPIEKWLSSYTDVLITINKEDFERAKGFNCRRVEYIPGVGVDLEKFKAKSYEQVVDLKKKLGIPKESKVFLSVGDLNKNKNHGIVIKTLPEFPNAWYVLCGRGNMDKKYIDIAKSLGVDNRLIIAGYRTDISIFYQMADVFVFPSIREGLGMALLEAMASETICVAAINRGTNDLIGNSILRFHPHDLTELKEKLHMALELDFSDEVKCNLTCAEKYSLKTTLSIMRQFYTAYLEDGILGTL